MKSILSMLAVCGETALLAASAAAPTPFRLLQQGNAATARLSEPRAGSIILQMASAARSNHIVVVSNLRREAITQQKLIFRVTGAPEYGAGAHLTPILCYTTAQSAAKWLAAQGPALKINNGEPRTYTLGLDTDFRLSDGNCTIRQIKFVLNGGSLPPGTPISIQISDIRIGDGTDGGGSRALTVLPAPRPRPVRQPLVKLFFALENDDRSPVIEGRRTNRWIQEKEPRLDAGFAELLLEHTDGIFAEAATLNDADVIVYSRLTRGPDDDAILRAVRQGKRLIAAGSIPVPELAALSGTSFAERAARGLPRRMGIHAAGSHESEVFADAEWSTALFPRFLDAAKHPDAELLLAYADGTPFLTRRGNVCQLTGPFGATVEKSDVFFDKLLLRLAAGNAQTRRALLDREHQFLRERADRERRIVADAARTAGKSADGFRVGASENNFGRFGWRIGVALGTGTLNQDLSFTAGDQSFRLSASQSEAMPLTDWRLRPLDPSIVLPAAPSILSSWSGVGMVAYTANAVIPESWKGKEIAFEVRDGIDDADEFFFNDTPAGKTGEDTPNHWMVPRRYVISPDRIRWGAPNTLRLHVKNLRGNAAVMSLPRLTAELAGSRPVITVPEINWTGRRLHIADGDRAYELRHSLLTPFLQHKFHDRTLFLAQENIADKAIWINAAGKPVSRSASLPGGVLYDRDRDGAWGAPWMLFCREREGRPLLTVFNRCPEKIIAVMQDEHLAGFRIVMPAGESVIAAGFAFGARLQGVPDHDAAPLPDGMRRHLDELAATALHYPVECHEVFRVDRQQRRIEVIDHFKAQYVPNEWNVPPFEYAWLPPLTAYMAERGMMVKTEPDCRDFALPTQFGPTRGVAGKSAVAYELALPDDADFQIPGIRDAACNAVQNEFFADGLRWSCGGSTPVDSWSAARPNGPLPGVNIDLFAWNFGLNSALQGLGFLTPENRAGLEQRLTRRFLEPLERYPFKAAARHRIEPFSRLTYPVLFQSYYQLPTPFAPGSASGVVYADANEAHTVAMWLVQQLEDLAGQTGLAEANWNFIRYLARYQLRLEDYAFQTGSCRDTGVGAWIDMLNCEYPGMMAYARNAALANDGAEADQALYRAARRAIPTLARLFFADYFETLHPAMRGKQYQITGFGEEGAKYMLFPTDTFNFLAAMDLFDFSEGFPGTLIALYRQYAAAPLARHLTERALPALLRAEQRSYAYLPPLAFFLPDAGQMSRYRAETMRLNRRRGDWPGMRRAFEIGATMWRDHGQITLTHFRRLHLHQSSFDPASGILSLTYTAGPDARLAVTSARAVRAVRDNGREIACPSGSAILELPAAPGKHRVEIQYTADATMRGESTVQ